MQTIKLPNGRLATSFVADDNSPLAIVHLSVLKRLATLLPTVTLANIIGRFHDKMYETNSLQEFVDLMKEEVAFHESVNLITTYVPEEPKEPEIVTIQVVLSSEAGLANNALNIAYLNDRAFTLTTEKTLYLGLYSVERETIENYITSLESSVFDVSMLKWVERQEVAQEAMGCSEVIDTETGKPLEDEYDYITISDDTAIAKGLNSVSELYKQYYEEHGWIIDSKFGHYPIVGEEWRIKIKKNGGRDKFE